MTLHVVPAFEFAAEHTSCGPNEGEGSQPPPCDFQHFPFLSRLSFRALFFFPPRRFQPFFLFLLSSSFLSHVPSRSPEFSSFFILFHSLQFYLPLSLPVTSCPSLHFVSFTRASSLFFFSSIRWLSDLFFLDSKNNSSNPLLPFSYYPITFHFFLHVFLPFGGFSSLVLLPPIPVAFISLHIFQSSDLVIPSSSPLWVTQCRCISLFYHTHDTNNRKELSGSHLETHNESGKLQRPLYFKTPDDRSIYLLNWKVFSLSIKNLNAFLHRVPSIVGR